MGKNIKKPILIFFFGVLLTIVALEAIFYIGGIAFKRHKAELNQQVIEERGTERVIYCLGDSTTAIGGKNAWPYQLQNILNEEQKEYTVLNKGKVLADSSDLLQSLKNKDKDHGIEYVVIMAGINDVKQDKKEEGWVSTLRRLKTFDFIKRLIPQLFDETEYISEKEMAEHENVRDNYSNIKRITESLGAKLVVMQYPLRDIKPLKEIFSGDNDVVLVENKNDFQKRIKKNGYEEFFVDRFGGDFGHCTERGNRLIAENVYETLFE